MKKRIDWQERDFPREFIRVSRNEQERLCIIFKCSLMTVNYALRFVRDTENTRKIQALAMRRKVDGGCGGVRYRIVEDARD